MQTETTTPKSRNHRIDSLDLLRGLVIVIMALDHVRDFFGPFPFQPEQLDQAPPMLFLTRWITHFCAPVFVLLAGTGSYLYGQRQGLPALRRFLVTRGFWLIFLELTWMNLSWWSYPMGWGFVQVIWILGWSMVLLAGLVWLLEKGLDERWLLTASLLLVAGHNLLDGIRAQELARPLAYLWALLHQQAWLGVGDGFGFMVVYPLLPWPAVMALGYLLGRWFTAPAAGGLGAGERQRRLLVLGIGSTVAFVLLRAWNLYGDPSPWIADDRGPLFTLLSFLNTTKYPPSLLFLLMTLGPALWLLPHLEAFRGKTAQFLLVFGRVPLFFYLIHFVVIHLLAVGYSQLRYGEVYWWQQAPQNWPESYRPSLLLVYGVWLLVVALHYPLCKWFAGVKRRRRESWIRYL